MEVRETAGFELRVSSNRSSSGGRWQTVPMLRNTTLQRACAVDIDATAAVGAGGVVRAPAGAVADTGVGAGAGAAVISQVRYNWYRVTCFANETKGGWGAGRCGLYSGGFPAAPFRIDVDADDGAR